MHNPPEFKQKVWLNDSQRGQMAIRQVGASLSSLPQYSLALEEVLQTQQALLPFRPVGAGAVVQDLSHILRLTQVVGDAAVP